ncbi:hypothetical protein N9232_00500 [Akkermansiaceae bacterium]|nr:hypothetical protein [Akkermansiaceae bacterium]
MATRPRKKVNKQAVDRQEAVVKNNRPLTLDEIKSSEYLMKSGILSGDLYNEETKEITRVFSKPEDAVTEGRILTQEDINSSAYLQENEVKAGDRFYDGQIYRSEYDDSWTQFKYGFAEEQGFLADVGVWLKSRFPMPATFTIDYDTDSFSMVEQASPDELYGEGFSEAPPEQRREMIIARKERQLQHDYGQFFDPNEDSGARLAGNITGMLADPTTLIPLGASAKVAATTGGVLAGSATAAKQYATTGELDPEGILLGTALGAIIPPALNKGASVIKDKSAKKLVDKAQAKIDEHMALGGDVKSISKVLQDSNINPAAVEQASKRLNTKVNVPLSQTAAERKVADSIARDSAVSRLYSKGLDKYLGSLSTRIGNISEGVKYRLRRFEFDSHVNTAKQSKKAEPFLVELKNAPRNVKTQITKHLYNGNFNAAEGLMRSVSTKMAVEFKDTIRPLLDELGTELKDAGHSFEKIDNYFPRLVKDHNKLLESLGVKEKGMLSKQLHEYAKKKKTSVANLTKEERAQVTDLALRGYRQTVDGGKPKFAKQRVLDEVDEDKLVHYANPEESLAMYIRNAVHDIEKRKFFGRSGAKNQAGKFDTDESVGTFVDDAIRSGEVPAARELELKELLESRFIGEANTPSAFWSTIRELGYLGTIANPISAITQFADAGVSSGLKGFRNTIQAMFGAKDVKIIDLGIEDLIATELAMGGPRKTAELLNKTMGIAGFKRVDRLGKETLINASLKRARNMAKTTKGEQALRKEVQAIFGKETDSFIADLKAGQISDNVKLYSFNKLADVQPIALSEMPEGYLRAKNGRLLYMLKSFTLKQLDIVRRNVVQEWNKGNKLQASKQAALLAGYVTVANMSTQSVKDLLMGREVRVEDIPDKSLWALLGAYGLNQYTYDRYLARGDVKGAAFAYVAPATPIIDAAFTLATELPEDDPKLEPVLRGIPLVGPLVYSWFGGGAEKYNERLDK